MSSFQLNLSSLTLGARERLARLDAAGGAIKAFLSPAASGTAAPTVSSSSAIGSSTSPSAAAPEGSRLSVEQLLTGGGGRSDEFILAGGSTGGLSVFVTTPDLLDTMCLGAVSGGVKFCTLDSSVCSFTTHAKKVEVRPGAIYISTGRQSAFSHHYALVDSLSVEQLERLLEERHSKEEWIRLLLGARQGSDGGDEGLSGNALPSTSVLDAITPGRKRKVRYKDEADLTAAQTPARGRMGVSLRESFESENELVILPSEELADLEVDDKVSTMWAQWSQVVTMVQRLGANLRTLKLLVAEDFSEVDSKVLGLKAVIGQQTGSQEFEDCGTLWEGLGLINSHLKDVMQECKNSCAESSVKVTSLEERVQESLKKVQENMEAGVAAGFKEFETAFKTLAEAVSTLNQEQEKLTESV